MPLSETSTTDAARNVKLWALAAALTFAAASAVYLTFFGGSSSSDPRPSTPSSSPSKKTRKTSSPSNPPAIETSPAPVHPKEENPVDMAQESDAKTPVKAGVPAAPEHKSPSWSDLVEDDERQVKESFFFSSVLFVVSSTSGFFFRWPKKPS